MERHSSSKKYNCSSCNKAFYCLKSKKQHERRSCSDQSWVCEICSKQLSSKFKLRAHKITHSQDRNFRCQICNQMFKEKRSLIKHVKNKHTETHSTPSQSRVESSSTHTETLSDPPTVEPLHPLPTLQPSWGNSFHLNANTFNNFFSHLEETAFTFMLTPFINFFKHKLKLPFVQFSIKRNFIMSSSA